MIKVKEHYGAEYRLHDPGNGVIGAALNTGQPYEAKLLYHIHRKRLTGRAIDVGAHIGNHSLYLALACGFQVTSFEPVEYDRLWENVKLNSAEDLIDVYSCALGSEDGWAVATGNGEIKMDAEGHIGVHRLDEYELDDVALMKIDVEGWEPNVLIGGVETIRRCQPILYVEARDRKAHAVNEKVMDVLNYRHSGMTFGATPMEEWIPC